MNITFLIGNGFDVNIGLKTQYTDFYPKYLDEMEKDEEQDEQDDLLYREIKRSADEKDWAFWSDFEKGLGIVTSRIDTSSAESVESFLDSKGRFEGLLAEYLKEEEKRFDASSIKIDEFQKSIVDFYLGLPRRERAKFVEWRSQVTDNIYYQFISFNYTDTLDRIINEAQTIENFSRHSVLDENSGNCETYRDQIGDLIHIHGTIFDDLVLGVDIVMQIENRSLRLDDAFTRCMVKPVLNMHLGENLTDRVLEIICESDYICIFGMSLGDTDLTWWRHLVEWLIEKESHRLVLYIYDPIRAGNPSGQERLRRSDKWKNEFIEKCEMSIKDADVVRQRLIVVNSSEIFNFTGGASGGKNSIKEAIAV